MDKHFKVLAESIAKTGWGISAKNTKIILYVLFVTKKWKERLIKLHVNLLKCLRERVKTRLRYVTSRKDKQSLPYIYKVICKECGKTEMKQSEKAKYCSKKCANSFTGRINRKKNREMRISIGGAC